LCQHICSKEEFKKEKTLTILQGFGIGGII